MTDVEFVSCPVCESTQLLSLVLRLGRCGVCDAAVAEFAHAGRVPVPDRRRGSDLWFWLGWGPSRRRGGSRGTGRRRHDR